MQAPQTLKSFQIGPAGPDGSAMITVEGSPCFLRVLCRAFPEVHMDDESGVRGSRRPDVWTLRLPRMQEDRMNRLRRMLHRISEPVLFLPNDLDECYALDWHTRKRVLEASEAEDLVRTELGELVYRAKPYDTGAHSGEREKVAQLAVRLVQFIRDHPTCENAELLVAAPESNSNKSFDLPHEIVTLVSESLSKPDASTSLRKIRQTQPMKELKSEQEKQANIKGALEAAPGTFARKTVLVIDDLYGSGATMNEIARTIRNAGASLVLGLTATKNRGNR